MVSYSVVPLLECYQVYSQQYRPTLGVVRNISIGMLNKVWTPARCMSHSEGVGRWLVQRPRHSGRSHKDCVHIVAGNLGYK